NILRSKIKLDELQDCPQLFEDFSASLLRCIKEMEFFITLFLTLFKHEKFTVSPSETKTKNEKFTVSPSKTKTKIVEFDENQVGYSTSNSRLHRFVTCLNRTLKLNKTDAFFEKDFRYGWAKGDLDCGFWALLYTSQQIPLPVLGEEGPVITKDVACKPLELKRYVVSEYLKQRGKRALQQEFAKYQGDEGVHDLEEWKAEKKKRKTMIDSLWWQLYFYINPFQRTTIILVESSLTPANDCLEILNRKSSENGINLLYGTPGHYDYIGVIPDESQKIWQKMHENMPHDGTYFSHSS
ncbi:hypothetical protein N9E76_00540, partial [bacterium]|nr:hypothetical protein [bacterium]